MMARATLLLSLLLLLPAPAVAQEGGWSAVGEAATHDRRTVWKAINGAAELYLSYGMKRLVVQSYRGRGVEAELQHYELGSPLDALGVFWRERPRAARRIKAGAAAAALPPHQCLARQGAHYLRLTASKGRLTGPACAALLRLVMKPLSGGAVAELALLPAASRLPASLRFSRRACFGLRELEGCLYADYKATRGKKHQLFAVVTANARETAAVWRRLARRWKATGKCGLTRTVPYRGTVVVVRTKKGILGAAGLPDTRTALAAVSRLGRCR